ncbi:hypothetical protein VTK26DRAFT_9055 [Humicola hyalothermophila]
MPDLLSGCTKTKGALHLFPKDRVYQASCCFSPCRYFTVNKPTARLFLAYISTRSTSPSGETFSNLQFVKPTDQSHVRQRRLLQVQVQVLALARVPQLGLRERPCLCHLSGTAHTPPSPRYHIQVPRRCTEGREAHEGAPPPLPSATVAATSFTNPWLLHPRNRPSPLVTSEICVPQAFHGTLRYTIMEVLPADESSGAADGGGRAYWVLRQKALEQSRDLLMGAAGGGGGGGGVGVGGGTMTTSDTPRPVVSMAAGVGAGVDGGGGGGAGGDGRTGMAFGMGMGLGLGLGY